MRAFPLVASVMVGLCAGVLTARAVASENPQAESERIVSQYKAVMNSPPQGVPSRNVVGAPLMGNGSMGVVISVEPQTWPLQFWTCKSSFCKLRHDHRKGGPRPFGGLDLSMPALKGSSWHTEQDVYSGITKGKFANSTHAVSMRTYVSATEDLLIIELTNDGKEPIDGGCKMWALPGRGSKEQVLDKIDDAKGKFLCATKAYLSGKEGGTHPSEIPTAAASAVKIVGQKELSFKLEPGKTVTIALALKSNFDEKDPLAAVQKLVLDLTDEKVAVLEKQHRQWWKDFWTKSLIEIGDPVLEKEYYLYNYQVGSSIKDKVFPPGLFGLWTTHDDPNWCGDYHLNFDWQSQYYAMYKCNFIEQADCFNQPALDFMERGKWLAKNCQNCRGVYYPVGIWAKGMESSRQPGRRNPAIENGGVFMGQRTNAAYCLVPMAMQWYHTYDLDYAKRVYPFVIEVVNFWEDYLRFELADSPPPKNPGARPPIATLNGVSIDKIPVSKLPPGRYAIYNDSIQETSGSDYNNLMSLGMAYNTFTLALDMSKELGVDVDRREKWQHIVKNLSKFPTFQKDGKTVFRYSEKGTEWIDGNSVGIQHIYPAGAIGLDDDPKLIEIALNTLNAKGRPWFSDNGLNSQYPAAVRMGYDPEIILDRLRKQGRMSNGFQGSIESSTLPNTINEMLCMSHRQVLRVFQGWPKKKDARFWNLRAEGAFLVSSSLKGGDVQYVMIHSEKGRDCTIVNPWPGKAVIVYRGDGKKVDTLKGDRFTLKSKAGETVMLGPEGED
ncbi:MAG: hypothetical protein WCJ35_04210 [Planctomycetota bacterium]